MVVYENECVDCGKPCIGANCRFMCAPHYYCDCCYDETQLYDYDDEQLCIECIKDRLTKVNDTF